MITVGSTHFLAELVDLAISEVTLRVLIEMNLDEMEYYSINATSMHHICDTVNYVLSPLSSVLDFAFWKLYLSTQALHERISNGGVSQETIQRTRMRLQLAVRGVFGHLFEFAQEISALNYAVTLLQSSNYFDCNTSKSRLHGTVKWFSIDAFYGFITSEDGQDIFVRGCDTGSSNGLNEGDEVEYTVGYDSRNRKIAVDITGVEAFTVQRNAVYNPFEHGSRPDKKNLPNMMDIFHSNKIGKEEMNSIFSHIDTSELERLEWEGLHGHSDNSFSKEVSDFENTFVTKEHVVWEEKQSAQFDGFFRNKSHSPIRSDPPPKKRAKKFTKSESEAKNIDENHKELKYLFNVLSEMTWGYYRRLKNVILRQEGVIEQIRAVNLLLTKLKFSPFTCLELKHKSETQTFIHHDAHKFVDNLDLLEKSYRKHFYLRQQRSLEELKAGDQLARMELLLYQTFGPSKGRSPEILERAVFAFILADRLGTIKIKDLKEYFKRKHLPWAVSTARSFMKKFEELQVFSKVRSGWQKMW